MIYRRQGRWRDALAAFARARERDPRRAHFEGQPETLRVLRQWGEAGEAYHRGLELEPQLADGWVGLAYVRFAQSGSPEESRAILDRLPDDLKEKPDVQQARWDYAMDARDFAAIEKLIPNRSQEEFPASPPAAWFRACTAVAQGETERAQSFLEEIKPIYEAGVRDHPDDPLFHAYQGKLYANSGEKKRRFVKLAAQLNYARRAKTRSPVPYMLSIWRSSMRMPAKWTRREAYFRGSLRLPGADGITLAHLRLSWEWDPLRQDARFQALLAAPEPPTVYQ